VVRVYELFARLSQVDDEVLFERHTEIWEPATKGLWRRGFEGIGYQAEGYNVIIEICEVAWQ
jgi:hypothetical protein